MTDLSKADLIYGVLRFIAASRYKRNRHTATRNDVSYWLRRRGCQGKPRDRLVNELVRRKLVTTWKDWEYGVARRPPLLYVLADAGRKLVVNRDREKAKPRRG